MSSFVENIYEEISLILNGEDVKITLNSTVLKIVKIETMFSRLIKHTNKTDIADIEYSVRCTKSQSNNPLNDFFLR